MELKNTFTGGKMNKDMDERLVPKGQYTHAENIRMANTDASDAGAIENVRGNMLLEDLGLTNASTIGTLADASNRLIYWFVTSDGYDEILEYDEAAGTTATVMSSEKAGDNVLNFSSSNLITGVNKIVSGDPEKDLLAWVDNLNNNRIINIAYAKANWATRGAVGSYVEADITVIKKPPAAAPTVVFTNTTNSENYIEDKFLSFAYRYKYKDGFISALSSFTNYKFIPEGFSMDFVTMENKGMVNLFNAVDITFNTGTDKVTDIELVYKESLSNTLYIIERFNKEERVLDGWVDNEERTFQFSNDKRYTALPADELLRTYDNVPRLSGAQELIGSRIAYADNLEGYNMDAPAGTPIKNDYTVAIDSTPMLGVETVVPTYFEASVVYDFTGIALTQNKILKFKFFLDENLGGVPTAGTAEFTTAFILPETFADVTALEANTAFGLFLTNTLTTVFTDSYVSTATGTAGTPSAFFTSSVTATSFKLWTPVIVYETPNENSYWWYLPANTSLTLETRNLQNSVKSNRGYEVGMVYLDEYGRKSTVETSSTNTVFIEPTLADNSNKIVTTIKHPPPYWADKYKLVFKQNMGDYENIFANIFYPEENFVWVKLEGTNKGKVEVDDILIVKQDLNGKLNTIVETRVLAIETKERNFIDENPVEFPNSPFNENEVLEFAGLYMKLRPENFDINLTGNTTRIFEAQVTSDAQPFQVNSTPAMFELGEDPPVTPISLYAGTTISMEIGVAGQTDKYPDDYQSVQYNKTFLVGKDYVWAYGGQGATTIGGRKAPIVDWFDTEVGDLGELGLALEGQEILPNNRGNGWDWEDDGSSIWVKQKITPPLNSVVGEEWITKIKIEINFTEGVVIFETKPKEIDTDIYYESEETFDIVNGDHQGSVDDVGQNQFLVPLTSGTLDANTYYTIKTYETDDDFTNLGAASNADGVTFLATGTTPTTWTNGSAVFKPAVIKSSFFNCFAFYNSLESYKYRDTLNGNRLGIDLRPSAVTVERYSEVRRYTDISYSEPYNENTSLNGLNEFNLSRANYKEDIEKKYGNIKKLYSRDSDLVVFQEDKVSKVLFGKDLLSNADGSSNIVSVDRVLGQQIMYAGEYGISNSPESFDFDGNNLYFTDSKNGVVLRLGANGITDISDTGLRTWFKDKFKISDDVYKLGVFDPYYDQYILAFGTGGAELGEDENTLSFDERVKGWTSFHTFRPDFMVGMNGSLYSFSNGNLYIHHDPNATSNEYYGTSSASKVSIMVNDSPSDIKELQAVSQEASTPWAAVLKAYRNNIDNFSTSTIFMSEFVEKEGHWFAYARRDENTNHLDSKSTYGIGEVYTVFTNSFSYVGGSALLTAGDTILRGSDLAVIGVVLTDIDNVITLTTPAFVNTPTNGTFIFGQKNSRIEGGSLRGYTIGCDLEITSADKVELYAVNLEVMQSKP